MFLKRLLITACIFSLLFLAACEDDTGPAQGSTPMDSLPDDVPALIDMLMEPQQTRGNEIMDALVVKGDPAPAFHVKVLPFATVAINTSPKLLNDHNPGSSDTLDAEAASPQLPVLHVSIPHP